MLQGLFTRMSITPLAGLALVVALAAGCSTAGPDALLVQPSAYEATFDAALDAARRDGLTPVLLDRRSGVIETEARVAGSLLEPWRIDNSGFDQTFENTLAYQRRRARFEFVPVGFRPTESTSDATLPGPDLTAVRQPPIDLTQTDEPMELRVWVYVERAYVEGLRRNTWTRQGTTRTRTVTPRDQGTVEPATYWTPSSRDEAYERRLLRQVEQSASRNDRSSF